MTDATAGAARDGGPAARLRRLGLLAVARPPASASRAVAGAGGALVAVAVVVVAGERWGTSGSSGLPVALTAGLLVSSVAAAVRAPAPVAIAGVAASGTAAPALAFFLSAGDGFPSIRSTAVLSAVLLGGLYLVGPWRGHTFHLAVLAAAGWLFALSLVDISLAGTVVDGFGSFGRDVTRAGVASIAVGLAYVGAGWWMDSHRLVGMATPVLGVGGVALVVGPLVVVRDSGDLAGGATAVAVGAALGLVGGRSRRRGTTWAGVAVVVLGVIALVDGLAPDDEVVAVALLLAAAGAALVLAAGAVARFLGEPPAGEPPPAPPRPEGSGPPVAPGPPGPA